MKVSITVKTLSQIIDCNYNTLSMYLCRADFSKFLLKPSPPTFSLEDGFIKELHNFFKLKGFTKKLEKLDNFWEQYNKKE